MKLSILSDKEHQALINRIRNQRETIKHQNRTVDIYKHKIDALEDSFLDLADANQDYESEIMDLTKKHNDLAEYCEKLQKQDAQHKKQLIAVHHAIDNSKVALR